MNKGKDAESSLKSVFLRFLPNEMLFLPEQSNKLNTIMQSIRRRMPSKYRRIPLDCNEQEKEVMKFLFENETVRSKQVEDLLNIKESRTRELLRGMVEKGFIEKHGQGRRTFYILAVKGESDV